jgi:hypothetical protein
VDKLASKKHSSLLGKLSQYFYSIGSKAFAATWQQKLAVESLLNFTLFYFIWFILSPNSVVMEENQP